jgi:predicted PurR-regulated permease PerM
MVALDDRTGNILTTVAVFAAVVAVAFAARNTLLVFVLALLLAYLLEPVVAGVERLLPWRSHARGVSVGLVYLLGLLLAVTATYTAAPTIADELRRLEAAVPEMVARVDGATGGDHGDIVRAAVSRSRHAVSGKAADIGWLLLVPVVAVFILGKRTALLDDAVTVFARRGDQAAARRTVQLIDQTLAQYARAQLTLVGLSAFYYAVSMALLGFPYPVALGVLGGALELVPVIGWVVAAATMLASGWLVNAPWIWMAALVAIWRGVQNVVISPRVMGSHLRMEPITVLCALMVGGQLGGVAGVVLSLPAVAILRIVCDERASRDKAPPVQA